MNGLYPYNNPLALTRVRIPPAKNKPTSVLPYSNPKAAFQDGANATNPSSREVWNVVAKLVHALSEARDDLAKLLVVDTASRRAEGKHMEPVPTQSPRYMTRRSSSVSPSRSLSAPAYPRRLESPTSRPNRLTSRRRDHEPYDNTSRRPDHEPYDSCHSPYETTALRPSSGGYSSSPVAFGMNLDFENVHRRQSEAVAGDRRLSARDYSITARGQSLGGPRYLSPRVFRHCESPRSGRNCTAVRYADLLKEEKNHLRQFRLAEEARSLGSNSSRRPSWC